MRPHLQLHHNNTPPNQEAFGFSQSIGELPDHVVESNTDFTDNQVDFEINQDTGFDSDDSKSQSDLSTCSEDTSDDERIATFDYNEDGDPEFEDRMMNIECEPTEIPIADDNDNSLPGRTTQYSFLDFQRAFPAQHNHRFFWQNYVETMCKGTKYGGVKGLVWRSVYRPRFFLHDEMSSEDDTRIMFKIVDHLLSCSDNQKETFLDIMDELMAKTTFVEDPTISIPRSMDDAKATCLEGTHAIFANFPIAKVRVIDNHAVVSLDEVIDHMMAHGIPIGWIQDSNGIRNKAGINGTPAADELLNRLRSKSKHPDQTAIGHIVFWSDGFLVSFVKQKNNSIWILTATFANPDGKATSPYHTVCLAIGRSRDDHTAVIDFFLKELETIRAGKMRYCALENKFVHTSLDLIAYLADLPERMSLMHTSMRGTFGKRAQYAGVIHQRTLPYCKRCFDNALNVVLSMPISTSNQQNRCARCWRWSFKHSVRAMNDTPTPEDYPTTISPLCPNPPEHRPVPSTTVAPWKIDFNWLRKGCEFAYHNLIHRSTTSGKRWLSGEATAYLRTFSINTVVRKMVWAKAKEHNKGSQLAAEELPLAPYIWNCGLSSSVFVASIMHQLFHGVIPDIMEVLHSFMTEHNLLTKFEEHANVYLKEISDMRLDWCKVKKLPKKQWLAEDVLGLSRIMPFIYSQFFFNLSIPESSDTTEDTLHAIRQLLNALHVMTSLLMSKREIDPDIIDQHIKIFLSCCDRLSESHYGRHDNVFWVEKGNFVSLLNLPDQIRQFGNLRLYWEGTRERYIQNVKKILVSLRQTSSYIAKKLAYLHRLNLLGWFKEELSKSKPRPRTGNDNFHRYASMDELKQKFDGGLPISAFHLEGCDDELFVAYSRNRNNTVHFVSIGYIMQQGHNEECGLHYAKCNITDHCDHGTWNELRELIVAYCVLLPFNPDNNTFENEYAIVFSDWDVVTDIGEKNLPSLSHKVFSVDVLR